MLVASSIQGDFGWPGPSYAFLLGHIMVDGKRQAKVMTKG